MSKYIINSLKCLKGGSHPEMERVIELIRSNTNIKENTNIIKFDFSTVRNIVINIYFLNNTKRIDRIQLRFNKISELLTFLPHALASLSTQNILSNCNTYHFSFYGEKKKFSKVFSIFDTVFKKPNNINTIVINCSDELRTFLPTVLLTNVKNLILGFISSGKDLRNILDKILGVENLYLYKYIFNYKTTDDGIEEFAELIRLGKIKSVGLVYNKGRDHKSDVINVYNTILNMPSDTIPISYNLFDDEYLVYDLSEYYTSDLLVKSATKR